MDYWFQPAVVSAGRLPGHNAVVVVVNLLPSFVSQQTMSDGWPGVDD
jgi:hypothetical protein